MIALSPNNDTVEIWSTGGSVTDVSKWQQKYVLLEHMGPVSGVDWSPVTNQIVTCGHDRNAYVWRFDSKNDEWKPTLVILRINRAATAVKWSPAGNKFAVASGAKCVPICHFEASNDWWISKMLKNNIKSTVLSIAWCVNNKFLVTGSADYKCRVYSSYIQGIDPAEDDGFGEVWAKQHEFGEVLCEFDQAKAWVQTVAWSPGGFRLAFSGHGSSVHFVQLLAGAEPVVQTVYLDGLPYLDMDFLSENCVVAVGFDRNPHLFAVTSGDQTNPVWSYADAVDKKEEKKEEKKASTSAFAASRQAFSAAVDKGHSVSGGPKKAESTIDTVHQNTITGLQVFRVADKPATTFSTSALDGRVVFWDVSKKKHIALSKVGLA